MKKIGIVLSLLGILLIVLFALLDYVGLGKGGNLDRRSYWALKVELGSFCSALVSCSLVGTGKFRSATASASELITFSICLLWFGGSLHSWCYMFGSLFIQCFF